MQGQIIEKDTLVEAFKEAFNGLLGNRREPAEQDHGQTTAELCKFYEMHVKKFKSDSYFKSVQLSNRHLLSFWGAGKLLRDINQMEAERYLMYLMEKTKGGFRIYWRNSKAMFSKAVEWEHIGKNPFNKIKLPKQQEQKPEYLTEEQMENILQTIRHDMIRNIVAFSFYTGCRLSEAVYLRWENVNLEERLVTIGGADFVTKTRKQRTIPVCDELHILLKRLKDRERGVQGLYVFQREDGGHYSRDFVSKSFKKTIRRLKLSDTLHFHNLRHSFASKLVQSGVNLYTVKDLLGHASVKTTEIYSHLNMNTLRQAIDSFNKTKEGEN